MTALPTPFADACGQHRPFRLAVEDAAGERIADGELDQPFALIGSDPACEVVLSHPSVPDRAAFLQVIDGNVMVVELTGLAVHKLTPESPLSLGPFTLHLLAPPTDAPPVPLGDPFREDSSGRRLPQVRLASLAGGDSAAQIVSQRLTLLGSPDAYLTLTPAGLFVTDLRVGTRVNGTPVRAALLSDGDELRVGREQYAIRAGGAPVRESPVAANLVSDALLGREPVEAASPADDSTEIIVPLVPLSEPRPAAPLPTRLAPELVPLLRQIGAIQCELMDHLRRELDAMVAGFDTLRREQLVAFGEEFVRLREVTAQLTREPAPTGVTTLASQPVELLEPFPPGDVYAADAGDEFGAVSEDTAAVHQELFERLSTLSEGRPGLWQRLRGLLGGRGEPKG